MTLLEKLAERSKTAQVKTAEQVFSEAFVDELEKLGYDAELLKQAGVGQWLGKAWGGVKSLGSAAFGSEKPTGGMALKLKRQMKAVPKVSPNMPPSTPAAATGDFPWHPADRDKGFTQKMDRRNLGKKASANEMNKEAIGFLAPLATRVLPALTKAWPAVKNFGKGALFFGGEGAAGTAGKVVGAGQMLHGTFAKPPKPAKNISRGPWGQSDYAKAASAKKSR